MKISDVDLNLLPLFDELIRTRKVSAAARALGMSQPASSYALAKLRKLFNDPLFIRTHAGLHPTPLALKLAPAISKALRTIQDEILLEPEISFQARDETRTFSINITAAGAVIFVPPILEHIATARNITINIVDHPADQLHHLMESGKVDLACGFLSGIQEMNLHRQLLFRNPFVCIARRSHPRLRGVLTREQYLLEEHAVVRRSPHESTWLDRELKQRGIQRQCKITVPHALNIPSIIENSDLLATIPQPLAERFCAAGDLQMYRLPVELPLLAGYQYWHTRFHRDSAIIWLRRATSELFRVA